MNDPMQEKNRKILIIDDNEAIHNDFDKILSEEVNSKSEMKDLMLAVLGEESSTKTEEPYELQHAYQGRDGFELVKESCQEGFPFALAFVDIRMPPGWDGIETIQHIWEVDPNIEIVICTAYSDYRWEEVNKKLKHHDRFIVLKKPFDNIEVRQIACALTEKWNFARKAEITLDQLNNLVKDRTRALTRSNDGLVELNNQLKENQKQLIQSEKMASIGLLAAGVAHEINNPISFVMSNMQTLKQYIAIFKTLMGDKRSLLKALENNDYEGIRKIVEKIKEHHTEHDMEFINEDIDNLISESHDGTMRVKDIVQNLKSFARLDEAEIEETDINACIETTLKVVWNELKYKCDVVKELSPLPRVMCYPQQLNQVFMNILINASHAIEEHGTVTIKTEATEKEVIIKFSDTGKGIPEENMAKLFDPFFTTKAVGKGTGLGLSISHGIIEKHKGHIDVESEVGKGTTFSIRIPLNCNDN